MSQVTRFPLRGSPLIGPSDDQIRVLEGLGLNPTVWRHTPRKDVTGFLMGRMNQGKKGVSRTERLTSAATKQAQRKREEIKKSGLRPGMRVLVQMKMGQPKQATIQEITPNGQIRLVGWKLSLSPVRLTPLSLLEDPVPTLNDSS